NSGEWVSLNSRGVPTPCTTPNYFGYLTKLRRGGRKTHKFFFGYWFCFSVGFRGFLGGLLVVRFWVVLCAEFFYGVFGGIFSGF
ncbi:hypothetical protein, partial [Salmonella enterica]|uniref:hypothetical protein n=1 Tax=Salmonella enterica TaxID=28901 RepID=UPI0020C44A84